jgi:cell division protease FtsH
MQPIAFVSHVALLPSCRRVLSLSPTAPPRRARAGVSGAGLAPRMAAQGPLSSAAQRAAALAVAAALAFNSVAIGPVHAAPVLNQARQEASPTSERSLGTPDAGARPLANGGVSDWRYSEFINAVEKNNVEKVTFSSDGQRLLAVDTDGNRFKLDALPNDPDLLKTLTDHKVDVTVLPSQPESTPGDFLRSLIFPAILFGGLFLLSRRAGGGAGPMGGFGSPMDLQKSGARVAMVPETGITFKDVAGVDGAKLELEEVVQFLKESERFTEIGAQNSAWRHP